jgi:hypothetical protein
MFDVSLCVPQGSHPRRVRNCQQRSCTGISLARRQRPAFGEERIRLHLGDACSPAELQDLHTGQQAKRSRLVRLGKALDELVHPLPVAERFRHIAISHPAGGARVPAGGFQSFPGLFPVTREERCLLIQLVGIECDDRTRSGSVRALPSICELRSVGHLLSERMLEGILRHGVERRLEDELSAFQGLKRFGEIQAGQLGDVLQKWLGELLADDRSRLQDLLVAFAEPVDPRCEHRLYAPRNRELVRRCAQTVAALRALEVSRLDQRLDDFLRKERVPTRALVNRLGQTGDARVAPQQIVQQLADRLRAEWRERELAVIRLLHPVGVVAGTEIDEQ